MSEKAYVYEEKKLETRSGGTMLLLSLAGLVMSATGIVLSAMFVRGAQGVLIALLSLLALVFIVLLCGLKIVKPNEGFVYTFFGKYYGTLRNEGFYWVNPFAQAFNPVVKTGMDVLSVEESSSKPTQPTVSGVITIGGSKAISLKTLTLNNDKQKINDKLGNPIIIGIVVIWRVVNTAKAVFNVDNYKEFLSIQCDSALRNIVRLYPYDSSSEDETEKTLRSSGQEISEKLRDEIQSKVDVAGLEIQEARITHLSYAPEIASVMLQRQQASAIIDARQMIVDGAVGMVEMALAKLNSNDIVHLDEERKAIMVSNLLLVLCANKDVQPVVNSGSLY
ncbi:MAG: SPFH domain-containing protein [Clostridiales bacterium]|jgi:regulator of protease activity HflC (stomatin/prohibitin superfamily)|nr:SPFH domain-containing protein [Clostridiales bacterium]